ncbi:hypothetical protein CTI14_42420 [Methylobacterium radiotolerans]|nr:hypothetical protein CTI14_42420 [Methylobacterium radiotolerans]
MIATITEALVAWRDDSDVQIVLLDGEGERGISGTSRCDEQFLLILPENRPGTRISWRNPAACDGVAWHP